MIPPNSSAVIFAGGKSSRMGRDKALLPFGGYNSLTEYQYRKLSKIFSPSNVYISAKSDKFDFQVNIIKDIYSISSPLVALISIFESLSVDELFILSVDTPLIDKEIIEKLYSSALPFKDATIAKSPNGAEPLCGIYRRGFLSSARELLEANNHKLNSLLNKMDTQYIEFDNQEKFINLNYFEDYVNFTSPSSISLNPIAVAFPCMLIK